jgi:CO/xanthine dehydrogenase Mo-binding subunit
MAVQNVAGKVRKQILEVAAVMLEKKPGQLVIRDGKVAPRAGGAEVSFPEIALRSLYGADQLQIGAIASRISHKSPPPFAAHFAEVEVDTLTGAVRVLRYVAAVDCGVAINPKLAEGQTEGAVLNGISYALTEEYLFNADGRMLNPNFLGYKIFSMSDKPALKTILVPSYEKTGPYGAKSVSEISINGPMPAIGNAIYNAVGVRLRETPFTPERVWKAMGKT